MLINISLKKATTNKIEYHFETQPGNQKPKRNRILQKKETRNVS